MKGDCKSLVKVLMNVVVKVLVNVVHCAQLEELDGGPNESLSVWRAGNPRNALRGEDVLPLAYN